MTDLGSPRVSLAGRMKKAWKRGGIAALARGASRNLREALFLKNEGIWFRRNLDGTVAWPPAVPDDVSLLAADVADVRRFALSEEIPWVDDEEDRVAMGNGHLALMLFRQGRPAGYIKAARNRVYIPDFRRTYALEKDTAMICDTYINRGHRGRRLSSLLIEAMLAELQKNGLQRVFCHIPPWNAPSIKNYRGCGFEDLYTVRFTRLFGLPFWSRRLPIEHDPGGQTP